VLIAVAYAFCLLMVSHLVGVVPASVAAGTADGAPITSTTPAVTGSTAPHAASEPAPDAAPPIRITVLYDNQSLRADLRSDWGFACLVEGGEKTVLFDTGSKPDILLGNMHALGVDPEDVDVVVLSHSHQDHTGGLSAILARHGDIAVYYPASFSEGFVRAVREAGATPIPVEAPSSVCPGLTATAPLGDSTEEIGLVVATAEGPVLITGCAHPGIATMARAAAQLGDGSLHAVLGGFHLTSRSTAQVEAIIGDLERLGVRRCGPAHCTGAAATAQMKKAFGDGFIRMGVGAVIEF